jgi:hypothetical protein
MWKSSRSTSSSRSIQPPELLGQLAALLADAGPVRIFIERGGRRIEMTNTAANVVRAAFEPEPTPAKQKPARECRPAILHVLAGAEVRMTAAAITSALNFMGVLWADRTLERELAALVGEGIIDNPPDARPRGYALVRNGGEGE